MLEDSACPCNNSCIFLQNWAAICVQKETQSAGSSAQILAFNERHIFPVEAQIWWNSGTAAVWIRSLLVCFLFIRSFPPQLKASIRRLSPACQANVEGWPLRCVNPTPLISAGDKSRSASEEDSAGMSSRIRSYSLLTIFSGVGGHLLLMSHDGRAPAAD